MLSVLNAFQQHFGSVIITNIVLKIKSLIYCAGTIMKAESDVLWNTNCPFIILPFGCATSPAIKI